MRICAIRVLHRRRIGILWIAILCCWNSLGGVVVAICRPSLDIDVSELVLTRMWDIFTSNPSSLSARGFFLCFLPATELERDSCGSFKASVELDGPMMRARAASYLASLCSRETGALFFLSSSLSFSELENMLEPFAIAGPVPRCKMVILGAGGGGVLAAVEGAVIPVKGGGMRQLGVLYRRTAEVVSSTR
jgi:hypothetical protein